MQVVRLADTPVVSFGPDAVYQPIIGDDQGSTPVRTGIQTSQPGYVTGLHAHPYMEVLFVLEGTATIEDFYRGMGYSLCGFGEVFRAGHTNWKTWVKK